MCHEPIDHATTGLPLGLTLKNREIRNILYAVMFTLGEIKSVLEEKEQALNITQYLQTGFESSQGVELLLLLSWYSAAFYMNFNIYQIEQPQFISLIYFAIVNSAALFSVIFINTPQITKLEIQRSIFRHYR